MNPQTQSSPPGSQDSQDSQELAQVVVLVLDLFNEDAMSTAAQMSLEMPEVVQALEVAQKLGMHLLLVAMTRAERSVSCMPVVDFGHLAQALQALCELIHAKDRAVSWVMIPQTLHEVVAPDIEKIAQLWETRIQGVLD